MTQNYTECEAYYEGICECSDIFDENNSHLVPCIDIKNCHYKQNKRNEHQIDLKNQDNDALSRYCEMLEKKITRLGNMQDKKVILE